MTQCKNCLLDDGCFDIKIDNSGTCSYCQVHNEFSGLLDEIGKHEELLRDRLERYRGVGEYDALVGLSGGKDSSYVIYRLARHYGARVLAFTCENGFMNDYGKNNIERIVQEMGVDHIWVEAPRPVKQAAYQTSMRSDGFPCSACFYIGESATLKLAADKKIPYIINGRTLDQILREPKREDFESPNEIIPDNLSKYDPKKAVEVANWRARRFRSYGEWMLPDKNVRELASKYCFYSTEDEPFQSDFAPEALSFFMYEKYDESAIIEELQQVSSWKPYESKSILSHGDCAAHSAAGYLYYHSRGIPFLSLEVASCIRQGKLSKSDGVKRLEEEIEHVSEYPSESMAALSDVCGLSEKELIEGLSRPKQRHGVKGLLRRLVS